MLITSWLQSEKPFDINSTKSETEIF